jgi:hypothetical protein
LLIGATTGLGLHAVAGGFDPPARSVPAKEHRAEGQSQGLLAPRSNRSAPPSNSPSGSALAVDTRSEPVTPGGRVPSPALARPERGGVTGREALDRGLSEQQALLDRGLSEQQALLDEARGALRRGDPNRALDAARAHRERFPDTAFEEERRAVRIRALLSLGREPEARAELSLFEAAFPKSLLLPSLQKSFEAAAAPRDFVTEPTGLPQTPGRR